MIDTELKLCLDMIDDCKYEFKKKDLNDTKVEPYSQMSIKDLSQSVVKNNTYASLNHECKIILTKSADFPEYVKEKPISLKRILNNFISNSCKYSKCVETNVKFILFKDYQQLTDCYPATFQITQYQRKECEQTEMKEN